MSKKKSKSTGTRRKGEIGGGRASSAAIEKRRAARSLNAAIQDSITARQLDGRTEKRRRRLLEELKEGRAGHTLKPIDQVSHVHELLALGETRATLRKQGIRPAASPPGGDVEAVVARAQAAYGFSPDAWRILGITLQDAAGSGKGSGGKEPPKAGKRSRPSQR